MPTEKVLESIGLGAIVGRDVLLVQLGILAATVVFVAFAFAVLIMAFRAAGRSRQALAEIQGHLRSVRDLAVEVRQLSAQTERTAARRYATADEKLAGASAPIRVSASETTPEAEVLVLDGEPNHDLDAAREAATAPRGLLGGLGRRRP